MDKSYIQTAPRHSLRLKYKDFKGQAGQDLLAYSYFKGKEEGFYIDIGANDGVYLNNTYIFEKIGWKGICVEPLPDLFKILTANRKCECYNVAVADKSGNEVEFIKAKGIEELSGLKEQMTDVHKKRISYERGKIEIIKVKTMTFDDIAGTFHDGRYIDFMSIDVEGAEMSILKTIDFTKYKFGLITVENNEETKGDGQRLKDFMYKNGYRILVDLGLDIMFIPK